MPFQGTAPGSDSPNAAAVTCQSAAAMLPKRPLRGRNRSASCRSIKVARREQQVVRAPRRGKLRGGKPGRRYQHQRHERRSQDNAKRGFNRAGHGENLQDVIVAGAHYNDRRGCFQFAGGTDFRPIVCDDQVELGPAECRCGGAVDPTEIFGIVSDVGVVGVLLRPLRGRADWVITQSGGVVAKAPQPPANG
jgi:hypothetical protein